MNKFNQLILSAGFFAILFGFMLTTLFSPDRPISEIENRTLQTFPAITKSTLASGKFFNNFEEYFTDQFFGRDQFVQTYTYSEVLQEKIQVNDVIVGEDGWLFTPPAAELRTEKINRTVQVLRQFMEKKPEGTDVFMSLVPHKSNILDHLIPPYFDHNYGYDNTQYFIDHRPPSIGIIDIQKQFLQDFTQEELNSFYFKTDHHWNIKGAYEAYKRTIESFNGAVEGFNEVPLAESQLSVQCLQGKEYKGSLNQQMHLLFPSSGENLCSYLPSADGVSMRAMDNAGNVRTSLPEIFGTGLGQPAIRYTNLFTSDYPIIEFENSKAANDLHVVVLKDSYANPIQPLLAQHFKKTTFLDLRYYKEQSVLALLEEQETDVLLMFYNNSNLFGDIYDEALGVELAPGSGNQLK